MIIIHSKKLCKIVSKYNKKTLLIEIGE